MSRSDPGARCRPGHNRTVLRPTPFLLLALAAPGCRSDVPVPLEEPPAADRMLDHPVPEGLEVLAARSRLTVGEGGGAVLSVELDVHTGGHGFTVADGEGVLGEDGVYVAILDLMAPGNDEIVTQAVETLSSAVEVPAAATRCVVRVRRWIRGWSYIVAPESFVVAEHEIRR
jgi:hypothetical protein